MNIAFQSIFWVRYPGFGLLDHKVSTGLNMEETANMCARLIQLLAFTSAMSEGSSSSTSAPALCNVCVCVSVCVCDFSHLSRCMLVSPVRFVCIFLVANDVEHCSCAYVSSLHHLG